MIYSITVLSEQNKPLPGAAVALSGNDGYGYLSFTTDAAGKVSFDDNATGNLSGVPVSFSVMLPGYKTDAWHNDQGLPSNDITVVLEKSVIQSAGVPIFFGLGALLLLAGEKKNKRKAVSGFDFKSDVMPYVFPAAVVIGGYLVYQKVFGDTPEQKQYKADLDAGIAAADQQAPQILTDAEIAIMAETLSNDISSFSGQTNIPDILAQFERINNTAELLRLIKAYGERWTFILGIPRGKFNLQDALKQNIDADTINLINQYFTNAQIHFQF